MLWYFKRQTDEISLEKIMTWQQKENLKRETESFLIAAPSNTIRTNYIKDKIDNTQQNRKYRLFGDRDEMINKISEISKLAKSEFSSRNDWVGKLIHKKLYKKLKFDQTNKWYMHKSESLR